MFISEILKRQNNNSKIAIKRGNNTITYIEWNNKSYHLSEKIQSCADKNTQCVGIFLPNSIDYAVAYFGVMFSSKVLVPIGIEAKKLEIISTIEYCEIDVLVTNSQYKEFILQVLANYTNKIVLIVIDTNETVIVNQENEVVLKSDSLIQYSSYDDVAIMLHTSGTTSNPKRVMLTHSNLVNNIESNIMSLELTSQDKVLVALPMYFGYCNTAQFLTHIYLGASIVILEGIFFPKQFLQTVQNEKITNFTGVPSMLLMLLKYRYKDEYDISSLRYICFGGGKMPVDRLKELISKYNNIGFIQTYGQTECSPRVTALLPQHSLSKIGSVGKPLPNVQINIVGEKDNELSTNKIGEIIVQGKNIMRGYFKQPQITDITIRNGWLHTGDLGYLDEEGFLYLAGRIKNIIISGGINIYPEEIEQILLKHPNIEDVCVVGEEHEMLIEVPIAKVVLNKSVDEALLKEYCFNKMAAYKVPVRFDICQELKKTYNGKIKRY